ncbi:esterase/lipase family protein [Caenimonas terrae]|uniref:Esterase/lipase family protein n=1 Tax=Caenimonas terrae TaxID=696074 RepID=A0ABW0NJ09_9BURK
MQSPTPAFDALRQPLRALLKRCAPSVRRDGDATLYLGQGQPVIVFPVLGGGPDSTAPLRSLLDEAGFTSYDWGMGVDTGPRDRNLNRWLRELEEKVIDVAETEGSSVSLLGWSLSGIYARELAKRTNPLVRQVITLGTPFNTSAEGHQQCPLIKVLEGGYGNLAVNLRHRLSQSPPVPCTSIYSRTDGLVPWRLCVEKESAQSENIEVDGATHRGLPAHPKVLEAITHRLAQPEGEWRPFGAAPARAYN